MEGKRYFLYWIFVISIVTAVFAAVGLPASISTIVVWEEMYKQMKRERYILCLLIFVDTSCFHGCD